jgi:magnesium-transporting ATPase (P-type)
MGWKEVILPVMAAAPPLTPLHTTLMAWHMLTVEFVALALWLSWLAWRHEALSKSSALFFCTLLALASIITGWMAFGNLTELPQWTLFVAAAIPILWAQRRRRQTS